MIERGLGDEGFDDQWWQLTVALMMDEVERNLIVDQALAALQAGDPRACYLHCVEALERDPEDYGALLLATYALLAVDDAKKAMITAQRLVDVHGEAWKSHIALGWVLVGVKEKRRAADVAMDAVRLAPGSVAASINAGEITAQLLSREAVARELAHRALTIDPSSGAAYRLLGDLRLRRGNAALAVPEYERALELDPHDTIARHRLAQAQLQAGSRSDAIRSLREVAEREGGAEMLAPAELPLRVALQSGCFGVLFLFAVVLFSAGYAVAAAPWLELLAIAAGVFAFAAAARIRRWVAWKLAPRRMAYAATRPEWYQRNPDLVICLVAGGYVLVLAGVAMYNAAT